jgi:N-methylhydantoinase A/oxoprolinase/acetone carboxylase beta subunit
MNKQIGLWIDHKRAVILTMSEQGENIQKIESGMGRHIRYRGATHPRTPYSAQYQQGDDQLDNKFTEQLNKFYGKVIAHIRMADSVLIFGPGEAKSELEKRLAHEKVCLRNVRIEPADKMTDRQIAAKVRSHFQESGTGT